MTAEGIYDHQTCSSVHLFSSAEDCFHPGCLSETPSGVKHLRWTAVVLGLPETLGFLQ